jgi:hypothetical protein
MTAEKLKITFAISLHPLLSPRMCCNFCSSSGVQGVLVRPFFLVADSDDAEGAVASVMSPADVVVMGFVGAPALFDARRFRGFAGAADVDA